MLSVDAYRLCYIFGSVVVSDNQYVKRICTWLHGCSQWHQSLGHLIWEL